MKTLRRFWWLAGIGAIVVVLATLLALPAWAAPTGQSIEPPSNTHAAMHGACLAGDVEGMTKYMNSLTEEERQAMNEAMSGSRQGTTDSPMAGSGGMMGNSSSGGMMGGQSVQSMTGMDGMMGGGSGQGMMGW